VSDLDLRAIRRRYHLLLALRFVPTGLSITVFVLLMRDRGLTLAEIGLGTAAQGIVMLVLELPSGGLADAVGRKPVLILAGVLSLLATAVLLVADSVMLLALSSVLMGLFRALDSGPLGAWFIDSSLAVDPGADVELGLARADMVTCASIGAGALLASVLVELDGVLGVDRLVTPLVVAMVIQVAGLVALVAVMRETRSGRGWTAMRRGVADVPHVMRDAVALIRRSRCLTALVAGELLWGFGAIAFERLLPMRLADVGGGVDEAAELLGPAVTGAWVLSALGAAAAPHLVRRFGSGWAGFGLRLAHGVTVVVMGLAAGPAGLIVAYLGTYWAHGATAPVHYGMVHRAVDSTHRATVVSANSLAAQAGFTLSGIALGALADATTVSTSMFVAAVVLAAAAPLYLVDCTRPARALDERIAVNA
jgi:hypothetical protein